MVCKAASGAGLVLISFTAMLKQPCCEPMAGRAFQMRFGITVLHQGVLLRLSVLDLPDFEWPCVSLPLLDFLADERDGDCN